MRFHLDLDEGYMESGSSISQLRVDSAGVERLCGSEGEDVSSR